MLYKNIRGRDLFQIFFVSAVASVLLIRFFLYITGYPQIGSSTLHIAHMLWGGLLMAISLLLLFGFLGKRSQQLAAFLGGAGFGVFIDEIGKFITADNDYFYRPSIGIIYAIFVVMFISFTYVSRTTKLSSKELQLNALQELEEAVAHDMDPGERLRVEQLLAKADQNSAITKGMLRVLKATPTTPPQSSSTFSRITAKLDNAYKNFWKQKSSSNVVKLVFIGQAVLIFLGVVLYQASNFDEFRELLRGEITYGAWLLIAELASALVALLIALRASVYIVTNHLKAFELFKTALLINILLTEFFSFTRIEFGALPGLLANLSLLLIISYAIKQERQTA